MILTQLDELYPVFFEKSEGQHSGIPILCAFCHSLNVGIRERYGPAEMFSKYIRRFCPLRNYESKVKWYQKTEEASFFRIHN